MNTVRVKTGEHGPWLEVPNAHRWGTATCENPSCGLVHIVSYDEHDNAICETTFSVEQLYRVISTVGG